MPTRSKFTADTRDAILQILATGGSRRTAAQVARVSPSQLGRWVQRGATASEDSRWREFHDAVLKAEASPRIRALQIIYREMDDNPALAWKFIERREPGYSRAPDPTDPIQETGVIHLSLDPYALPKEDPR
jgi:transposase-like protein